MKISDFKWLIQCQKENYRMHSQELILNSHWRINSARWGLVTLRGKSTSNLTPPTHWRCFQWSYKWCWWPWWARRSGGGPGGHRDQHHEREQRRGVWPHVQRHLGQGDRGGRGHVRAQPGGRGRAQELCDPRTQAQERDGEKHGTLSQYSSLGHKNLSPNIASLLGLRPNIVWSITCCVAMFNVLCETLLMCRGMNLMKLIITISWRSSTCTSCLWTAGSRAGTSPPRPSRTRQYPSDSSGEPQ